MWHGHAAPTATTLLVLFKRFLASYSLSLVACKLVRAGRLAMNYFMILG